MPTRLPTSSRMDPEFRPTRAALRKRPSGRSRLQQDDPSTISSPAQAAADPDKAGRPRSDRNPHNHSPPTLTSTRIQIRILRPFGDQTGNASGVVVSRRGSEPSARMVPDVRAAAVAVGAEGDPAVVAGPRGVRGSGARERDE